MEDREATNLCQSCRKELECFRAGFFDRANCDEYEPMTLQELVHRDQFVRALIVGACPNCASEETEDCLDDPTLEDDTIGRCRDCGAYWCLECGYLLQGQEMHTKCPHWYICDECRETRGYLDPVEFTEKICSDCEHWDDGCLIEDPSECDKQKLYLCPFEGDISMCPRIQDFLSQQI